MLRELLEIAQYLKRMVKKLGLDQQTYFWTGLESGQWHILQGKRKKSDKIICQALCGISPIFAKLPPLETGILSAHDAQDPRKCSPVLEKLCCVCLLIFLKDLLSNAIDLGRKRK